MSVFENDWIMRQIEGMTDMLGKVLLHREKSEIRIEEELTDEDVKTYYNNIQMLLKENEVQRSSPISSGKFRNRQHGISKGCTYRL